MFTLKTISINIEIRYINLLIRQVKSNYYRHKIASSDGDPLKFWSTVSEITSRLAVKERLLFEILAGMVILQLPKNL